MKRTPTLTYPPRVTIPAGTQMFPTSSLNYGTMRPCTSSYERIARVLGYSRQRSGYLRVVLDEPRQPLEYEVFQADTRVPS